MVPSITKKLLEGDKKFANLKLDTMVAEKEEMTLVGNQSNKNVQPSGKLRPGKYPSGAELPA